MNQAYFKKSVSSMSMEPVLYQFLKQPVIGPLLPSQKERVLLWPCMWLKLYVLLCHLRFFNTPVNCQQASNQGSLCRSFSAKTCHCFSFACPTLNLLLMFVHCTLYCLLTWHCQNRMLFYETVDENFQVVHPRCVCSTMSTM